MTESTTTVECPICGTEFDPAAAGGWCTNSECGEWKYDGEDAPTPEAGAEATSDPGADADVADAADGADAIGDRDEGATPAGADTSEATAADAGTAGDGVEEAGEGAAAPSAAAAADPEDAADGETGAADAGESEAAADPEAGEPDAGAAESGAAGLACPDCGADLEAEASFCPSCGTDVSDLPAGEATDPLGECPSCGADVDPEDSFCASCGEDLEAHRGDPAPLTACPSCEAAVEPEDSFCASCGEDLEAHREAGADTAPAGDEAADPEDRAAEVPDALVVRTHGEELTVGDDETLGREVRRIVTEAGGDQDDAVRIHREHVRFVRGEEGFALVDLGDNPTAVDGESLQKGDRVPIAPGDEIDLSGVVTLTVAEP